MMMNKNICTIIGLTAILQFSSITGILKKISNNIGADLAVTLLYTLSTVILICIYGIPKIKNTPKKNIFFLTVIFVVYELSFSYSIALSISSQQSIEIALINYLWPSITILMLIFFKELKFNYFVLIGVVISFFGIFYIQLKNGIFDFNSILINIESNPLSYILSLISAILWSFYCVITRKFSNGDNPIVIYFFATSIVLWINIVFFNSTDEVLFVDYIMVSYIFLVAVFTALGYAAWNVGVVKGNITILIALSYFSPVFSTLISSYILDVYLTNKFWFGVFLVTIGSIVCWVATNFNFIKKIVLFKKKHHLK